MWRKTSNRRGGILRQFKKNEDGVSAIEFAFVGPPFIYLLCCIFETGIMLFSEYVIENGVAQAARMIRTGQVDAQGMSKIKFKEIVCGKMAVFLKCDENLYVDVRSFDDFSDIALPPAISPDKELTPDVSSGSQWCPGNPGEVVVVRTYYTWKLFTPGISRLANLNGGYRLLTSGAAFRNEPYPPANTNC